MLRRHPSYLQRFFLLSLCAVLRIIGSKSYENKYLGKVAITTGIKLLLCFWWVIIRI